MRALIVGLGSIGRRHLANLRALNPEADITVLRHASNGQTVPPDADRQVFSLEHALGMKPQVALICSPAAYHMEAARPLAEAGVHLFIEKPISDKVDGIRELIALCDRSNVTLMVGYNLRFLESLNAVRDALHQGEIGRLVSVRAEVGQYLPDWRPSVDYRQTASASAALGGGATLELSHEIDLVRWLCGEVVAVTGMTARLGDLEIDVEDTTEMILRLESGAFASVHLDMLQTQPVRSCRLIGTAGTLTWEAVRGEIPPTYSAELAEFLACARTGSKPRVTGYDGLRVLEIALEAKLAST